MARINKGNSKKKTSKKLLTPKGLVKAFYMGMCADFALNYGRAGGAILTSIPISSVQTAGYAYRGMGELASGGVYQMLDIFGIAVKGVLVPLGEQAINPAPKP